MEITIEQLQKWLNRPKGAIHGELLANLDEILKLAIEAKFVRGVEEL